jgi:hypothetical protein
MPFQKKKKKTGARHPPHLACHEDKPGKILNHASLRAASGRHTEKFTARGMLGIFSNL